HVGAPLVTTADVGSVVVSARSGGLVHVRDVATVVEDHGERDSYVMHTGRDGITSSAVTISVSKRPGANATKVANAVLTRVDDARDRLVPRDVDITVTRNYGATAADKAGELILHLAIATLSVTFLI